MHCLHVDVFAPWRSVLHSRRRYVSGITFCLAGFPRQGLPDNHFVLDNASNVAPEARFDFKDVRLDNLAEFAEGYWSHMGARGITACGLKDNGMFKPFGPSLRQLDVCDRCEIMSTAGVY